jgi:OmpA family
MYETVASFSPTGIRRVDEELRGLSEVDVSNSLGLGAYDGELRHGPDGQLYKWVQTVDGLGNLTGFWKSISNVAKAVAKPVLTAAAPVVKAATDVASGAVRLLSKPQCIPLIPLRSPIRLIAKAICPIVQQPVVRTIAPIVPFVGPIIQGAGRFCNLAKDCGIAGLEDGLMEAADVMLPGQPYSVLDRFAFASSMLAAKHQQQIGNIARYVLAQQSTDSPIRWVYVVGHTDPVGTNERNCGLGMRRARAVVQSLMNLIASLNGGRIPEQLGVIRETRGSTEPVKGERALSRRVEVFLLRSDRPPELRGKCPQPAWCMCTR